MGTTSPLATLSVSNYGGTQSQFIVSSSTGASATTTSFVINKFGNIGVNTASPNFNLEVNGTASTTNLYATNATSTKFYKYKSLCRDFQLRHKRHDSLSVSALTAINSTSTSATTTNLAFTNLPNSILGQIPTDKSSHHQQSERTCFRALTISGVSLGQNLAALTANRKRNSFILRFIRRISRSNCWTQFFKRKCMDICFDDNVCWRSDGTHGDDDKCNDDELGDFFALSSTLSTNGNANPFSGYHDWRRTYVFR